MSELSGSDLVAELSSPRFWRRQTAKRLLVERADASVSDSLRSLISKQSESTSVIAALHVLDSLGQLTAAELSRALQHKDPAVVVQGLRLADTRFQDHPQLLEQAFTLVNESDERMPPAVGIVVWRIK